jgi:hypothetical protein
LWAFERKGDFVPFFSLEIVKDTDYSCKYYTGHGVDDLSILNVILDVKDVK